MLKRKVIDSLLDWADKPYSHVPLVVGARQIGKTYIIRKFLKETFDNIVEINFVTNPDYCKIFEGNLEIDNLVTEISVRVPGAKLIPGKTAIFLDEIQDCPDAKTAFKPFVEDGRFRVIASGSLLGIRQKQPRSIPVGFMEEIKMYPLDFEEFLWGLGISSDITKVIRNNIATKTPYSESILEMLERYFSLYMIIGGMPDAVKTYVNTKNILDVRRMQNIIITGYREDITKYAEESEKDKIYACFDSIPVHLSKESKKFSYKIIDEEFVPTYKTYESSINWMSNAAMVNLCYNLDGPNMPLHEHKNEKQFKMYMADTGLLTCILGINVAKSILSKDTHVNKGAVTENVVSQCLVSNGFDLYYFKSDSLEIDFIFTLGRSVAAAEIKSGNNKQSKSLDSFKNKYGVKRRMKFEMSNIFTDEKGIEHYPLFACSFVRDLQPDPEVDISIDTESFLKEFR